MEAEVEAMLAFRDTIQFETWVVQGLARRVRDKADDRGGGGCKGQDVNG